MSSGANKTPGKHNDFAPHWLKVNNNLPLQQPCQRQSDNTQIDDDHYENSVSKQKSLDIANRNIPVTYSQDENHKHSYRTFERCNGPNGKWKNGLSDPRAVTSRKNSRHRQENSKHTNENHHNDGDSDSQIDNTKSSIEDEFPSLNGGGSYGVVTTTCEDKTFESLKSIKSVGVWEKPLKTFRLSTHISKSGKEIESKPTMYKASVSSKNRLRTPLTTDASISYSSSVNIPLSYKTVSYCKINGENKKNYCLNLSIDKEKQLLKTMGWNEDENGENDEITEEDKHEFEKKLHEMHAQCLSGQFHGDVSMEAINNAMKRLENLSSSLS